MEDFEEENLLGEDGMDQPQNPLTQEEEDHLMGEIDIFIRTEFEVGDFLAEVQEEEAVGGPIELPSLGHCELQTGGPAEELLTLANPCAEVAGNSMEALPRCETGRRV